MCQQCIFKVETQELDLGAIEGANEFNMSKKGQKISVEVGPVLKVIERRAYEESKNYFPYYNWKAFEITRLKN